MAKKEDLKGLLEQYFPNNDTGEITTGDLGDQVYHLAQKLSDLRLGDLARVVVREKDYRCKYSR